MASTAESARANKNADGISKHRKSVIVTGGASGIGLAMVRYFASQGHRIAILDVNESVGQQIVTQVARNFPQATISFKKSNVSSWDQQASAFKEVFEESGGRLDVVMANAGVSEQGATTVVDLQEVEPSKPRLKSVDVNLIGTIYSVKLAVHYMNKNSETAGSSRGSIICTSSNAGLYAFPVAPLYAASKAGVIGLVRSVAKLVEKSNIQINALAPAVLETNIAPDPALFKKMLITPMSTLTRGVEELLADPKLSGAVAEIHGNRVTLRPPLEFVDADSKKNVEMFWTLGYA